MQHGHNTITPPSIPPPEKRAAMPVPTERSKRYKAFRLQCKRTDDEGNESTVDVVYRVYLWTTNSAFRKKQELAELGLEEFAAYASMSGFDPSGVDLENMPLVKIVTQLFERLREIGYAERIIDLVQHVERRDGDDWVQITGKGSDFEDYYAGRTFEVDQIAWEVLRANLGDFIDGALSSVEGRHKKSSVASKAELALQYAESANKPLMELHLLEMVRELGERLEAAQEKELAKLEMAKKMSEAITPDPSKQPNPST